MAREQFQALNISQYPPHPRFGIKHLVLGRPFYVVADPEDWQEKADLLQLLFFMLRGFDLGVVPKVIRDYQQRNSALNCSCSWSATEA